MEEKERVIVKHQPFLLGKSVYLKALTEDEITDRYLAWLNDENVCRFTRHNVQPFTRWKAEAYVRSLSDANDSLVLAVYARQDDQHIGNISLGLIDWVNRNADFSIIIGEVDYWGTGMAKEAALLIIRHGFETLNLHRIYCGTHAENISMQRLALYLGMKEEGRRRDVHFKNGSYADGLEYGVLKAEFLEIHSTR
ncbi:MAG: GNAT family N-acetyltransferase [Candidatus Melainabacteria bacterium]|nr:GNAT family N-acetyltransferase [Candidatus Melainabacteria bacterium]